MLAVRLRRNSDLRVDQVPEPDAVGPGQVRVEPQWCGICGTDLHEYAHGPLAVANTMVAFAEGATLADACLAGAGAGAGNCQLEALVAVMEKAAMGTGIDLWTLEDIADQVVRPIMTTPPIVDRATLTQGFAGVPGSFLHHAFGAADRFGVDARDILVEVGRRKSVGGQEDLVIEVAARLAATERPAAS